MIFDIYRIVYINSISIAYFPTNYLFYLLLKIDLQDILNNIIPETVFYVIKEDIELVNLSANFPTSSSLISLPTLIPLPLTSPAQIFNIEREIDLNLAIYPYSGY